MKKNVSRAALSLAILSVATLVGVTTAPPTPALAAPTHPAVKTTVYVCPMHPAVVSAKPGQCPRCKMPLKKKSVAAVYTCPMHPKVLALKPGKCPVCKMTLKKK